MKKIYLYSLLALTGALASACDPNSVDDVDFDIALKNSTQEVYVGDPVTFNFSGKVDYIVFYSGEDGQKHANKDRLKVEIASAELSYTILQRYTRAPHRDMEILSILVSEDFSGGNSIAAIEKATWQRLSGREEGQLKVPTCPVNGNGTETVSDKMDLSLYKDKKFYLAFHYYAPAKTPIVSTETNAPRIDVQPLVITKKLADGSEVAMNDPKTQFAFQFVQTQELAGASFDTNNSALLLQPNNNMQKDVDVWAISQPIDLTAISPDKGTPIKALNMSTASYTHIYEQPGEYTVTFVASNANQWNSKSTLREMKVVVKERPTEQIPE